MARRNEEPAADLGEEAAGVDLDRAFTDIVQGDASGYRIYVYQVHPAPKYRPGRPAYIERFEAGEIMGDLEPEIGRRFGAGVYRLELRTREGERVRVGEIQVSERAITRSDAGELRREPSDRLARIEAQVLALAQAIESRAAAPAAGGLDMLERVAVILRNVNSPPVDMTALAGFGMQALQTGVRLGRGMEPNDRDGGFDWRGLAEAFGSLLSRYAPPAEPAAPTLPVSPPQVRPAPAPEPDLSQPRFRVGSPHNPRNQPMPAAPPEEPEAEEDDDEGYTLEELIGYIDDAIGKAGDPEWWAAWVLQFAAPDVVDAVTVAGVEAMRLRLQGNASFPGWNAEHAGDWLQRCARRLELLRAQAGGPR